MILILKIRDGTTQSHTAAEGEDQSKVRVFLSTVNVTEICSFSY